MKRIIAILLGCVALARLAAAGELEKEFTDPPDSARMWTWWFWLGDKVDEASITADLEALKERGMGGVTVYSLSGPGVADKGPDYMSPAWRRLWKHTLKEADRLGLGVSTMLCSGWNAGGPWIKPENACKQHVHSELVVDGPRHFEGPLPMPPADNRFYRDIAIQALPVNAQVSGPQVSASSSHARYPVANAADGNANSFWVSNGEKPNEGPGKDKPEWLQVDLGKDRPVKQLTIAPRPGFGPRDAELQSSADGKTFTTVKRLAMERDQTTNIDLPGNPVRYLRLFITATWSPQSENVQVCEISVDGKPLCLRVPADLLSWKTLEQSFGNSMGTPIREICDAPLRPMPEAGPGMATAPASLVDLTEKTGADGVLKWDVPPGKWRIIRSGYTLTGKVTSWSSPTGSGLESDPLDAAAMDFQFANVAAPLIADAGPQAGRTFRSVQIDSWETELPNWSGGFPEQFRKLRGYDAKPYLPVLAGYMIGDSETSDRFLYDYRKTVGECLTNNYFGRLSQLAEVGGIIQQSEAGGVCTPKVMAMDALANLGRCAIPMGEFWQDGTWVEANQNKNGKQTATAAHVYGKRVVAAEAFTSFVHWIDSPASLKPTADRAFCEGFNHFFIFSSATHSGDGWPGTEFCAGTHFNRKITWWNQARPFTDYVARCSHLLQQGLFAADVLFYNGDGCPNFVAPKHVDPLLGPGYDYDVCNSEVIMSRLSVKDGRIVLPDGMSYRMLALPARDDMPLEVLVRIKELVAAGMTVVGPKPAKDPGLRDFLRRDAQVKAIADELWGANAGPKVGENRYGKGRVIRGTPLRDVLARDGVNPDFTCAATSPDAFIDWIHRRTDGADIYFLANRNNRDEQAVCTFRVAGKQPEIWDPVTGSRRDAAAFTRTDGATSIPLDFAPHGSVFIVFRKPLDSVRPAAATTNTPALAPVLEIKGPWTVKFDTRWGGPESVAFAELADWTTRPEDGIRFYSGKATYLKTFELPPSDPAGGASFWLDLGSVQHLAEVRLNGKPLGVVWTQPYRLDISRAARPGTNHLEVDIINLWPNRLIGDAPLPPEKRLTRTNINMNGQKPIPSGLLGPVKVMAGH